MREDRVDYPLETEDGGMPEVGGGRGIDVSGRRRFLMAGLDRLEAAATPESVRVLLGRAGRTPLDQDSEECELGQRRS